MEIEKFLNAKNNVCLKEELIKKDLLETLNFVEIERGHCQILSLVEELGPYLTSTDVSVRTMGVKTLSKVLSSLAKDHLDKTELQFLSNFYCDRLKDHHSIGPSTILGILAIVCIQFSDFLLLSFLYHCLYDCFIGANETLAD